jgi:hypothetical protein
MQVRFIPGNSRYPDQLLLPSSPCRKPCQLPVGSSVQHWPNWGEVIDVWPEFNSPRSAECNRRARFDQRHREHRVRRGLSQFIVDKRILGRLEAGQLQARGYILQQELGTSSFCSTFSYA